MFLHLCVLLFTGGREVCLTPPRMQNPLGSPPGLGDPPGLGRPPRMQTPRGWADPPPPIRSTSGRYASYRNAYLFPFAGEVLWQKGPVLEGIVFAPEGVTVSEDGRVIVPESLNKRVVTFHPDTDGYDVVSVSN